MGGDPVASARAGIGVARVRLWLFVLTATFAAVAGVLYVGATGAAQTTLGNDLALQIYAPILLGGYSLTRGGIGVPLAAIAGVITLDLVANVLDNRSIDPYWQNIITGAVIFLAVYGHRLVAVDQRGHGESTPVGSADEFGLDLLADDLDALLDRVPDDAVLGGGSMGAAVLTRWALRHPDSGRTLAFVVPAVGLTLPPGIAVVETFVDRMDALGRDRAVALTRSELIEQGFGVADADAALAPWLRQPERSLAIAIRSILGWHLLDDWEQRRAIRSPAAVIGVHGDPLHPAEVACRYAEELPDARLRLVADPFEAAVPGRLGREISAALASVATAP